MERLRDGEVVAITGDEVRLGDDVVAVGRRPSVAELEAGVEQARSSLGAALERFATNTLEHLKRESHLAMDAPDVPEVGVEMQDREVLVVVRGQDHREDLIALKRSGYLRERKPVLIGVDGGADALLELGLEADDHHRRLRLGQRAGAAVRGQARRARLPRRPGAGRGPPGAARPRLRRVRGPRHQRGHRAAAGLREGRRADRGRRHPHGHGGVPRQGPRGHGVHVPRPAEGRAVCSWTPRA